MAETTDGTGPAASGVEGDAPRRQTETLGSQGGSQGAGTEPAQPPQGAAVSTPPATRLTPPPPPASQSAQSQPAVQPVPSVTVPSPTTEPAPQGAADDGGVAAGDADAQRFMDEGDAGLAGQPDIMAQPKPSDEGPNDDDVPRADIRPWYQRPGWLAFCGLCGLLAILLLVFALNNGEDEGKKAVAPAQKPVVTATAQSTGGSADAASVAPTQEPPEVAGGGGGIPAATPATTPAPPASAGGTVSPSPSPSPSASQPSGAMAVDGAIVPSGAVVGLAAGASEQASRAEAKADEAKAKVAEFEAKVAELQRKLDDATKAGAVDVAKLREEFTAAKAALERARRAAPPSPVAPSAASAQPPPASAGSGVAGSSAATHLLVDPAAYLKFCLKYGGTQEGCDRTLKDLKQ